MSYALNTLETVKKLTATSAFTQEQAELIVNNLAVDQSDIVTKPFLKSELHSLERRFDSKFEQLEEKVNLKLTAYKSDIIAKIYIGMVGLGGVLIAAMAII